MTGPLYMQQSNPIHTKKCTLPKGPRYFRNKTLSALSKIGEPISTTACQADILRGVQNNFNAQ